VDRFFPPDASPEQKLAAQQAMADEIARRDDAKSRIIVAELSQGDNYTKRARPTVVYGGLLMIAINYVLFPFLARLAAASYLFSGAAGQVPQSLINLLSPLDLPGEFWAAWGGVVGTWVLGRSLEKRGATGNLGKIAGLITGKQ
jgi:hypothetical protein